MTRELNEPPSTTTRTTRRGSRRCEASGSPLGASCRNRVGPERGSGVEPSEAVTRKARRRRLDQLRFISPARSIMDQDGECFELLLECIVAHDDSSEQRCVCWRRIEPNPIRSNSSSSPRESIAARTARADADLPGTDRKAMKEFYALLKPTLPHDQLQVSPLFPELIYRPTDSLAMTCSEAMHTSFSITLSQLSTHLTKSSRIQQTTAFEVAQYRQEQAEIDQQSLSTRQRIQELAQQLERAKEERSRRIEYDSLTKVINRLPDREKGLE